MASLPTLRPATHYPAITGQVLAWLREQRGWTQRQMADALGVSPPVWSRVERGEVPVRLETLAAAAQLLDRSPGEILAMADRMREGVERRGVHVLRDRPSDLIVAGAIVIGVAALAALITELLAKPGRR